MSKVSKKVVNWLYTVIQPQYVYKDIVYTDTVRFLNLYLGQGFKIRTSVFVSSNGSSELLLCTTGSLAVAKGPVSITIWIPLNYPFSNPDAIRSEANGVPLVFVNPPSDLSISPGNNVDAQGRFYHPYLSQWYSAHRNESSSAEYNLLHLLDCLHGAFNREFPMREKASGPAVPPKDSIHVQSAQSGPRRQTSGPPLPTKPTTSMHAQTSIPERYRSPPPLPNQKMQQLQHNMSINTSTAIDSAVSLSHSTRHEENNVMTHDHEKRTGSNLQKPQTSEIAVEDLMDQMSLETKEKHISEDNFKSLSDQIMNVIAEGQPENINSMIVQVSKIVKDMEPLKEHLDHHNTQAKANSDNLDKHILYLKDQLHALKLLNGDLAKIKDLNQSTVKEVHTSSQSSMSIEDIIVPDSALVSQLYETISDIKASNDCIKLIEGGFQDQPELINNDNLDACVKSVRAISRDLFWLEVTKNQISQRMGLDC